MGIRTDELPNAGHSLGDTFLRTESCLLAPKVRISPYKFEREEQTLS